MSTYTDLSNRSIDGVLETSVQGRLMGSLTTMPAPSEKYNGSIVLYTGANTESYTNGKYYRCLLSGGIYIWDVFDIRSIPVDDALSTTSENPVQNKVVKTKLDTIDSEILDLEQNKQDTLIGTGVNQNIKSINNESLMGTGNIALQTPLQIGTNMDAQPTQNSTNPVASGGVYSDVVDLQEQIDAISVKSDVVDIVATYTALMNYDTSKLANNDIIKVLQDSTHNNAISYYRWVISQGTGTWTYIGSEGPYYTKSEADNNFIEESQLSDVPPASGSSDTTIPSSLAVYKALTNGTVSKVGTANVGSATRPVYLSLGVPTQIDYTLGTASEKTAQEQGSATGSVITEDDTKVPTSKAVFSAINTLDGNVLHKTGNETKTGQLTIQYGSSSVPSLITTTTTPIVALRSTLLDVSDSTESVHTCYILGKDKNDNSVGGIGFRYVGTSQQGSTVIYAYSYDLLSTTPTRHEDQIRFISDWATGTSNSRLITYTAVRGYDSANTTDFLTIGNLENGNITFNGANTFTGINTYANVGINRAIGIKTTNQDISQPNFQYGTELNWIDNSDRLLGTLRVDVNPNGTTTLRCFVRNSDGSYKESVINTGNVIS